MTLENQIERDTNLAKDNWTCHACEYGEKFEHKFQLVNHWHKQHSNQEIMYEVCQWCSELFTSPDSCKTVSIYLVVFHKKRIKNLQYCYYRGSFRTDSMGS